jgi:hypothetical protein
MSGSRVATAPGMDWINELIFPRGVGATSLAREKKELLKPDLQ